MDRWFGPDGAITSLPDPTKFVPTRPLIDDLFDPLLGREFYKVWQPLLFPTNRYLFSFRLTQPIMKVVYPMIRSDPIDTAWTSI